MGCDGGTIPKRCEMIREKQKPEKVDKEIELNAKWFHCALTQEELREPIVSCELGNLYRKESVLEYLLDKSKATTDIARHIRSLKDVKELVLTKNNIKTKVDAYLDFHASDYICPISGLAMNGHYRFCFSLKCGCVFSERGLKEVPSTTCHNCGELFDKQDIVVINGRKDDIEKLRENMVERRHKAKELKKAKKSKKVAAENGENSLKDTKMSKKVIVEKGESGCQSTKTSKRVAAENDENGLKDTNKLKRVIVENGESGHQGTKKLKRTTEENGGPTDTKSTKKPKIPVDKNEASTSTTKSKQTINSLTKISDATYSKYHSVAENPDASKVFKSLFSSGHKNDPKSLKSNWITHPAYHC